MERKDAFMEKSELELVVPDYKLVKQIGQGGKSIVWAGEKTPYSMQSSFLMQKMKIQIQQPDLIERFNFFTITKHHA